MPRLADIIAQTLVAHGVRHAFGMPGGEVVTLLDGLRAAGIGFTLCRHETAGAIMAAGAATVSGAPAVLLTTLGPGLANAVNGIADAAQEHVPLIILSGAVDHGLRGRFTHQILDHAALLRPLVKGSFEIGPAGVGATVARALALATQAPAGPVHLDLTPGLAARMAGPDEAPWSPPRIHHPAPGPDDAAIRALAARLHAAERPLILAGFEAAQALRWQGGAAESLAALLRLRAVPVLTTYKAKGLMDETGPLALGGAGLSPLADAMLLPLVASADLVLLLGYDPIEMRAGWIDPFAAACHVVELSAAPADHGMHRSDVRLIGPLGGMLAALAASMAGMETRSAPPWPDGQPASVAARLAVAFADPGTAGRLTPHAAFDRLAAGLPAAATITVDSGAHRILFSQRWRCRRPLELLQSAGFCTMGAALPLAIGAARAGAPGPVVAVLGDGGLEMGVGELATLRDAGLPVLVFVLQDDSLALIALKQREAGLAAAGVGLGRTDFAALARAFGGFGATVDTMAGLDSALAEALTHLGTSQSFALIACRIEAESYRGRI